MKILLTGSTGFLGSHLLCALLNAGHTVSILKRSTSNPRRIQHLLGRVMVYDIDRTPIERAFESDKFDAVIHTACNYGRGDEPTHEVVESNLMFGLRLLEVAISFNTDTFLNTDTLLPNYLNTYTLSKKQFVEWLKQYSSKILVVNFRLEHLYGSGDDQSKFVGWLLEQLKQKVGVIKLTPGQQQRDFIHVDDVVSAYLHMLDKVHLLNNFNQYDVGTGNTVSIQFFAEKLRQVYQSFHGHSPTRLEFGAIPYREGEIMRVEVDISKLAALGWRAQTSLDQGINQLIQGNF